MEAAGSPGQYFRIGNFLKKFFLYGDLSRESSIVISQVHSFACLLYQTNCLSTIIGNHI